MIAHTVMSAAVHVVKVLPAQSSNILCCTQLKCGVILLITRIILVSPCSKVITLLLKLVASQP